MMLRDTFFKCAFWQTNFFLQWSLTYPAHFWDSIYIAENCLIDPEIQLSGHHSYAGEQRCPDKRDSSAVCLKTKMVTSSQKMKINTIFDESVVA